MKQWFTGKFRGHYRGHPQVPSQLSPYAGAPHFRIEVYEALVSDIELGPLVAHPQTRESSPTEEGDKSATSEDDASEPPPPNEFRAHHEPQGAVLHQPHIGKLHLVDPVRRGQVLRSTAHDVLMSGFSLSHPAEFSGGSLGHIEGTISGWYKPSPPPPEVEEVPAFSSPPPIGWRTEARDDLGLQEHGRQSGAGQKRPNSAVSREQPPKVVHQRARQGDIQKLQLGDDLANEQELDAALSAEAPSAEYPFFSIGMGLTLLLAFFATPFAAVLFAGTFLLSYGVRSWLLGVVPDVSGVRVLALFLGSGQILVAALLIAHIETVGCVSLSPLPLIWLLGAQLVASLLPRPLTFALTTGGFAAVLLQTYASWAPPHCQAEAPADVVQPATDAAAAPPR